METESQRDRLLTGSGWLVSGELRAAFSSLRAQRCRAHPPGMMGTLTAESHGRGAGPTSPLLPVTPTFLRLEPYSCPWASTPPPTSPFLPSATLCTK